MEIRVSEIIGLRRLLCPWVVRYVPIVVALWLTGVVYAAGPGFAAILGGSGQDYASSVAADGKGNTYVAGLTYSPDFRVNAGALQTKAGGGSDAFVAKFGADGSLLWSTYLGGCCDDWATGVAVDASGNVAVTGWTRSADFPVAHPAQGSLNHGVSAARFDGFVAKLNPSGTELLYSTFLGGPDDDGAYALALDASGNAYVTGSVQVAAGFTGFAASATGFGIFVSKFDPAGALVYSFFHPAGSFAGLAAAAGIAVDFAGSAYVAGSASSFYPVGATHTLGPQGDTQAMLFKLAPDGSRKIYETTIGGSVDSYGMAVAVDGSGAAYLAGTTNSVDFPLLNPLQSALGARSLWKSTDGAANWSALGDLPFAFLQTIVVDPTASNVLYAATLDGGVFKSTDAGGTWNKASKGIASPKVQALAIDPLHPQTLFAATASSVYQTVDGGGNWRMVDSIVGDGIIQLAIDAKSPNNIYRTGGGVTRKSRDGGATWSDLPFPGTSIQSLAIDPNVSGNIYAYSVAVIGKSLPFVPSSIYHSTDGGQTWTKITDPLPATFAVWTIDGSTNPSTVYNGLNSRSTDGGQTWTPLPSSPVSGANTSAVAVDAEGTLYAAVYNSGMYVSRDHGQSWSQTGSPLLPSANFTGFTGGISRIIPAASGTVYDVLGNNQTSGFVSKLSPDGGSLVFSTLLNGHVSFGSLVTYAAQPGVFATQNWISAITLDAAGNAVVAGGTRSSDFPTVNAVQAENTGGSAAFAATISADGSKLLASTYLGGSGDDGALAVAADRQGNVILAGQTWSLDFPVPGGVQAPAGLGEAFVVKLAPVKRPRR